MNNNKNNTTLVLGGTGKTGSRVAAGLTSLGFPVRIGSRKSAIPFDWGNAETWKPVLENIHSVYISFQPDLAVPGAVESIAAFAAMAKNRGAKKLVLLSGRGEPEAKECEEAVIATGVDFTIVRASWFFQNFSESHLLEPILAGYVALPVGNIGEPFIDVEDIADVAITALTSEGHSNKIYEVTGARLLTFSEAIQEIAAASGKNIHYEQITFDEYKIQLTAHGVPETFIQLISYLFSDVMDGRNAFITDGVEKALKRKPADFSDFVKRTVDAGIWQQQLSEQ